MRIYPACMVFGILGLLPATAVYADQFGSATPPPAMRFTLETGITEGGDKLTTVNFRDGSSRSLYAGNSRYLALGVIRDFGNPHWSLMGTVGYAYAGVVSPPNAPYRTISFSHLPLEITGLYSFDRNHFSFGVRYDVNPRLDLDGFGPNGHFGNAWGWLAEYRWWLFGVRYTNITYRSPQGNVSGNSWGAFFNYTF